MLLPFLVTVGLFQESTRLLSIPQGEDAAERVSQGRRYAREEKFLEAASEFRQALQLEPTHEPAALEFTNLLYNLGRREEAYAVSRQLLREHPNLLRVRLNLASLLQKAGNLEAAREEAQKVLAEFEEEASRDDPVRLYALHLLGRNLLNSERYEESEQHLLKVVELNPEFPEVHLNLAQLYTLMPESSEKAVPHFQKVVELVPGLASARLHFGKTLLDLGKVHQAIAQLEKAVELDTDSQEAYYRLASAYRKQGNIAKTQEVLSRFQELDSKSRLQERSRAKAQTFYKEAYTNRDNVEKAIQAFEKAVELFPDYHEAHYGLAQSYLNRSRPQEALKQIERALRLQPHNPSYHHIRALCLQELRNIPSALEAARSAARLNPAQSAYHNLVGNLLFENHQYREAVPAYRKAVDSDPTNPLYHLNLSSALARINSLEESSKEKGLYRKLLTQ